MTALFLGLVVLAMAALAVGLSSRIYGRSRAARLPTVLAIVCGVAGLVIFAVGEVRYHRCVDHVNAVRAHGNGRTNAGGSPDTKLGIGTT